MHKDAIPMQSIDYLTKMDGGNVLSSIDNGKYRKFSQIPKKIIQ